jgi:hypothetical protein
VRIHWWFDRAFDAYTEALANGRPTLIIFSARPCGFCKTMEDKFRCPALVRYAGEMEFAITRRNEDPGGDHLAAALDVVRCPTLIMLRTHLDKLHVVGRIEVVFSAEEIDRVIAEGFKTVEETGPFLRSLEEECRALDEAKIARPTESFCAVGVPK